jgi:hypothetical protein
MNINDLYSVERIPCKTEREDTTHRQCPLRPLYYRLLHITVSRAFVNSAIGQVINTSPLMHYDANSIPETGSAPSTPARASYKQAVPGTTCLEGKRSKHSHVSTHPTCYFAITVLSANFDSVICWLTVFTVTVVSMCCRFHVPLCRGRDRDRLVSGTCR